MCETRGYATAHLKITTDTEVNRGMTQPALLSYLTIEVNYAVKSISGTDHTWIQAKAPP